jgi:radical SAM superfamily enzyme YgiQ (UPF0313 family)
MLLYLINPSNSLAAVTKTKMNTGRWKRFRIWKPLSLVVLAGLTPEEWETVIVDENVISPDYDAMPRPDLVGITAFTAQANRAYEVATYYRNKSVPVVMGGIHATMCLEEALQRVDSVVTGEAETIWPKVLDDVKNGRLKRLYDGGLVNMNDIPVTRHDLLSSGYGFGTVQTTRGCPLNCSFCSVTSFNGNSYRQRPIEDVVREFQLISEKYVLVADDNLIGTSPQHLARTKDLFRAMIQANLRKKWVAQVTINFADDEELMELASKAGCKIVLIGFESPEPEGLIEVGKKFNLRNGRDFQESVRRIQRHNIFVIGSFIIGLDIDKPGIGNRVAEVAGQYGLDNLQVLFLTPLPGTRLMEQMTSAGHISLNTYPDDWKYYTLNYPVALYKNFSVDGIIEEMISCDRKFYSISSILRRVWINLWQWRAPIFTFVINLLFRSELWLSSYAYKDFRNYYSIRQGTTMQWSVKSEYIKALGKVTN